MTAIKSFRLKFRGQFTEVPGTVYLIPEYPQSESVANK